MTQTQTKTGVLIDHLVGLFPDGVAGGQPLQVIDGPGAIDIRNNVLYVGYSMYSRSHAASGQQNWATIGQGTRREEVSVNCSLRVGVGNKDMRGARDRAIAIFEAIAAQFRASPAGLTAAGQFQQIQVPRYQLYQELAEGVSVTIEFTVSATARI